VDLLWAEAEADQDASLGAQLDLLESYVSGCPLMDAEDSTTDTLMGVDTLDYFTTLSSPSLSFHNQPASSKRKKKQSLSIDTSLPSAPALTATDDVLASTIVEDDTFLHVQDSFCRNFTCCGLTLPDMHALLQHFEDQHVLVDDDNLNDDDTSGDAESDAESDDVLAAESEQMAAIAAFEDSIIRAMSNANDQDQHPFVRRVGDVEDDLGVLVLDLLQEELERESKRLKVMSDVVSTSNCTVHQRKKGHRADSSEEEIDVVTIESGRCEGNFAVPTVSFPSSATPASAPMPGDDEEELTERHVAEAEKRKRDFAMFFDDGGERIEKPYRCPHPSCDKAYKNPNGLKYHIQHGHCEGGDDEVDMGMPFILLRSHRVMSLNHCPT
jgi:transcription factor SFP1